MLKKRETDKAYPSCSDAVEYAGIGLLRCDADGAILAINKNAMRIFGVDTEFPDPSDVTGMNISQIIQKTDSGDVFPGEVFQTDEIHDLEYSITCRSGAKKNILHDSYIAVDENGTKTVDIIIRDITALKLPEGGVTDTEAKMRAILDSANDAVFMADNVGRIVYLNRAAKNMFGYKKGEAIGKVVYAFFSSEKFVKQHYEVFREFEKTDGDSITGKTIELVSVRKDGIEFPIELSISAVNIEGRLYRIGIIRDITKRRIAEDALRDSEKRFRTIYESSLIGILLSHEEGKIIRANPAAVDFFGYSEEELRNMTFAEFSHHGELEENMRLYKELKEGKRDSYRMQKRYYHKSGKIIWGDLVVSAVRDENGKFLYTVSLVEDITNRRRLEDELKERVDKSP